MAIKYVDIEYLRAQNSSAGQIFVAGQSNAVTYSNNVLIDNQGDLLLNNNANIAGNIIVLGSQSVFSDTVILGTSSPEASYGSNLLTVYGNVNILSNNGQYLVNGNPLFSGANIINDITTDSDNFYLSMSNNKVSGNLVDTVVSSDKLYFNPSSGTLSSIKNKVLSSVDSTSWDSGALVVSGGVGIGSSLNVRNSITANSINSQNIYGNVSGNTGQFTSFIQSPEIQTNLIVSNVAQVSSIITNNIDSTGINSVYGNFDNLQVANTTIVDSLTSNGTISGTDVTFRSLQSSDIATVNELRSNSAISGTIFEGTDAFFTNIQCSDETVVNSLKSNTTISSNTATFTYLQTSQLTTVESLVSNSIISGSTGNFDSIKSNGIAIAQSIVSNSTVSGNNFMLGGVVASAVGMADTVIDTVPLNDFRTIHYIAQITDNTNLFYQSTQFMILHNGSTVFKSEYNIMFTEASLGTFDAIIDGTDLKIIFKSIKSSTVTIKLVRTGITI